MANTVIQIRRSTTTSAPSSLAQGELAFTSNGDTLWIGSPSGSNTANVVHIGAKISYFANSTQIGGSVGGSNSELASTYAIKQYVDGKVSTFSTSLSGLTDVDVAGVANNNLLVYNAATSKWEDHTISGTSNQVDVSFTGQDITVGLSDNVDITANVTIGGSANVSGEMHVFNVLHVNPDHPQHYVHFISNPTLIATVDVNSFGQVAMQNFNAGANASADFVAYPNNTQADDNTGFIDMGITSNGFNQAAFSVTGPNDGYIFQSARAGDNLGGSLVLATDSTGTNNDIKFFVGGFTFNANSPHMVLASNTRSLGINNAAPVSTLSVGGNAWINGKAETQHVLPLANNTYSLGNNDLNWAGVYAQTVVANQGLFTNVAGTITTSNQSLITTVGTLTDLSVAGNTQLGDASSDVVSFTARVNTAIVPSSNVAYDLGTTNLRWNSVYANTGNFVNVNIAGDLTVEGTLTTIDTQNIVVEDSLIRLARNQANTDTYTDAVDIGFYGVYGNTSSTFYAGLARESGTDNFVLFSNNAVSPDNDGVELGDSLATLYAFLNAGALVSNATNVTITANSTLDVAIVANTLSLSTALGVASGGTGRSTLTANALLVGNNAGEVTLLSSSTEGHVLQINSSGAPTFAGLDGGTF